MNAKSAARQRVKAPAAGHKAHAKQAFASGSRISSLTGCKQDRRANALRYSTRRQDASRFTLNAPAVGTAFAAKPQGHWVRIAVERFDWKARAALRKKSRKSWDAIRQLIHYREVVGEDAPITAQACETGELFRDKSDSAT